MTEKERYASVGTWVRVFAEEGIAVSDQHIRMKLKEGGIIGETGRERIGRLLRKGFFAESDVRRVIAEHLTPVTVDQDGFLTMGGKRYAAISRWAELFEVSYGIILRRVEGKNAAVIKGKGLNGKINDLYAEEDIYTAISDLIGDFPVADKDGFIKKDGERYATVAAWAKYLSINNQVIYNKLKRIELPSLQGKDKVGHIVQFYRETDIRQLLTDELSKLYCIDENGFCVIDGERYAVCFAWRREFGWGAHIIANRMKGKNVPYVKGRDQGGKVLRMYAESVIRNLCSDQFEEHPEVQDDGFIIMGNERYATLNKWAEVLNVSDPTIRRRFAKANLPSIRGKTQNGHVHDFFAESVVRPILDDLLQDIPKADEDGFFVIDGERYATLYRWVNIFSLDVRRVIRALKHNPLPSKQGKPRSGPLSDFYAESDMRRFQASLISKKSKK